MILRLKRLHADLLRQETENVQPVEACAMLFGKLSHAEAVVEKVVFAPNRLQSPTRFEIDPEKIAAAFTEAEEKGLEFVGLFHSHSAPAAPSSIDLEGMKLWGNALWMILSLTDGKLAAYQLPNGLVEEVTISLE